MNMLMVVVGLVFGQMALMLIALGFTLLLGILAQACYALAKLMTFFASCLGLSVL